MFRIVCLVDDKKLSQVLRAMTGLVVNMEAPQAVMNAVARNGKVQQASSETSVKGRLIEAVQKRKGKQLTTNELKDMIAGLGAGRGSYHYYIQTLKKDKVVKPKSRGLFMVL